jgi:AcrR family transcriptional regulator
VSLRERKKRQTRQLLSDTATGLFLAKGFDAVRVTEIAEACGVSEKTVFNYFPTKEALILDRGETLPAALRSALADPAAPPVAAALAVLAGELSALIGRMSAHPDFAEAREQTRRFGELIRSTPSLRAYQHEVTERLTTMTAEILAARAGADADAPEPLAAAHALLGLWPVQYASLRRHLETAPTPEALCAAVTADIHRAARIIEAGLATWVTGGPAGRRRS